VRASQRAAGVFTLFLMASLPTVAVATPASASWATCWGAGRACLYEDAGWQGDEYGRVSSPGYYELGGWNGDNEISSLLNNTPYCLTIYSSDGWSGRTWTLGPYDDIGTLDDNGIYFNDDAESYRLWSC
jgi:Peptidase inhibitor family I36